MFISYFLISTEKKKMHSINRKLEGAMECKKKELMQQTKELEESKAHNDLERRNLMNVIEKVSMVVTGHLSISQSLEVYKNWKFHIVLKYKLYSVDSK